MENIIHTLYTSLATTIVWFLAGAVLYMNPVVANVYKRYKDHPSMKKWPTQAKYLAGTFLVAGFIPILLINIMFVYIAPISFFAFGLILFGVRIIPRFCDAWMQTSYPNTILLIELINGFILSFVIAFMLSVFY